MHQEMNISLVLKHNTVQYTGLCTDVWVHAVTYYTRSLAAMSFVRLLHLK